MPHGPGGHPFFPGEFACSKRLSARAAGLGGLWRQGNGAPIGQVRTARAGHCRGCAAASTRCAWRTAGWRSRRATWRPWRSAEPSWPANGTWPWWRTPRAAAPKRSSEASWRSTSRGGPGPWVDEAATAPEHSESHGVAVDARRGAPQAGGAGGGEHRLVAGAPRDQLPAPGEAERRDAWCFSRWRRVSRPSPRHNFQLEWRQKAVEVLNVDVERQPVASPFEAGSCRLIRGTSGLVSCRSLRLSGAFLRASSRRRPRRSPARPAIAARPRRRRCRRPRPPRRASCRPSASAPWVPRGRWPRMLERDLENLKTGTPTVKDGLTSALAAVAGEGSARGDEVRGATAARR